jgi:hypothetical protein
MYIKFYARYLIYPELKKTNGIEVAHNLEADV